jgi:beta-lactamase superfamily II metal-dependent hydrolase
MLNVTQTLVLIFILTWALSIYATPREYATFERSQKVDYGPDPALLIRIWMFEVGQGDAILIQIPGNLVGRDENFDVLVDTGSYYKKNQHKAKAAIKSLYPEGGTIEQLVISHHDSDHVSGMSALLGDDSIGVENIWHNGLASYLPSAFLVNQETLMQVPGVHSTSGGKVNRFMGHYNKVTDIINEKYYINSLEDLRLRYSENILQGIYKTLAKDILDKKKPFKVNQFNRFNTEEEFILGDNDVAKANGISFNPIWPTQSLSRYNKWSETINGNSVTFKFNYGDFSMLFTGDHNEKSEIELLKHYGDSANSVLEADILKVPHHGSKHNDEGFFNAVSPVLGVASMGSKGFKSNWKHPSKQVVDFLGGSHRLYSTYIHEKRFSYESVIYDYDRLVEQNTILIETDGKWFRVLELESVSHNVQIPNVKSVLSGDGTRWIKALEQ